MYVGLYNKAGDLANPRAFSLGFEPQVYNAFMKDVGEKFLPSCQQYFPWIQPRFKNAHFRYHKRYLFRQEG